MRIRCIIMQVLFKKGQGIFNLGRGIFKNTTSPPRKDVVK